MPNFTNGRHPKRYTKYRWLFNKFFTVDDANIWSTDDKKAVAQIHTNNCKETVLADKKQNQILRNKQEKKILKLIEIRTNVMKITSYNIKTPRWASSLNTSGRKWQKRQVITGKRMSLTAAKTNTCTTKLVASFRILEPIKDRPRRWPMHSKRFTTNCNTATFIASIGLLLN